MESTTRFYNGTSITFKGGSMNSVLLVTLIWLVNIPIIWISLFFCCQCVFFSLLRGTTVFFLFPKLLGTKVILAVKPFMINKLSTGFDNLTGYFWEIAVCLFQYSYLDMNNRLLYGLEPYLKISRNLYLTKMSCCYCLFI